MAYIDVVTKFNTTYEIRDHRFAESTISAADLNKISGISTVANDRVIVTNASGQIVGSNEYLKSATIIDPTSSKLKDEVIPDGFIKKVELLTDEPQPKIKDEYIPSGFLVRSDIIDTTTDKIKDNLYDTNIVKTGTIYDENTGKFKESLIPDSFVKESELFDSETEKIKSALLPDDVVHKAQILETIGGQSYFKSDMLNKNVVVTSVNGESPTAGNVTVNRVALADNLYSDNNDTDYDAYKFRTSGGSASLTTGPATLSYIEGHSYAEGRTDDQFNSVCTPPITITNFDGNVFKLHDGVTSGLENPNVFTYNGNSWSFNNQTVNINEFGISPSGLLAERHTLSRNMGTDGNFDVDWGENDAGLSIFRAKAFTEQQVLFKYDGNGAWYLNDIVSTITDLATSYGIRIKAVAGQSEAVLPTASFTETHVLQQGSTLEFDIDVAKYRASTVEDVYNRWGNTIYLTYTYTMSQGQYWAYSFTGGDEDWHKIEGSLEDFGVVDVTGTPALGDKITLTYATGNATVSVDWRPATVGTITITYIPGIRGTIYSTKPTKFVAVGLNAYDKDNMSLDGYGISASGEISTVAGSSIAVVPAVGGCLGSTNVAGYTVTLLNVTEEEAESTNIENQQSLIGDIWYSPVKVDAGTIPSGVKLTKVWTGSPSDDYGERCHVDFGEANGFLYIVLNSSVKANLCVHPAWSEYMDKFYGPYFESEIDLSGIKTLDEISGTYVNLPLQEYGMPSVGTTAEASTKDILNFETGVYTKKIRRIANTTENMAATITYCTTHGTTFDYDANYIYMVLASSDYENLNAYWQVDGSWVKVNGSYIANDFGTEEFRFSSTAGYSELAVFVQILYGQNLKDKLRTDVLTLSAMNLTAAQQDTVQSYLGIATMLNPINAKLQNINYVRNESSASDTTVSIAPNTELVLTTSRSANFTVSLQAPVAGLACEWRLVFKNDSASEITLTLQGPSGYSFISDDGAATTLTCDAESYCEVSFANLLGGKIGVACKAWSDTAS